MKVEEIYADLPTLETERLILRKLTMDDLEDMFAYASKDEVTKYVTWETHQTLEDTKRFLEFALNQYEQQKVAPWGMEEKETGKIIGTIDFVWWHPQHHSAEIGYVLNPSYWGKGITTEAARAIIDFGFKNMDLVRIQARCFVENIGSERVMEKTGMEYEGILRKAMFVKGVHHDLKMYSIIKA
ncbi:MULTISPECIES: GNAT family N-acetyltransferase [unclassified Bacillus (in: firmicutes)]|uniref:GNAT family N-acetyltransferase n=1 Tax=unclassified Bacillus (in: firmicutes) TaxID=185979 RepID=UPI0008E4F241|nr:MULTISPECIES: GNAT family protein [unclassified Bacillus (in: firmicutes)]SFB07395.1 ribosomal-protein-alanine N-acetyltransferase [Bacillus sp. UNCCL13]SFQ87355.1 ribosomal-protein-alanine N-acetyltransferase [Bacillus sp. cl95]